MKNIVIIFALLAGLVIGIFTGGYLFRDTQPRFIYRLEKNQANSTTDDILGYLTSIGLNNFPGSFIPNVIQESEKSIVIDHPFPENDLHYVILPKKDLRSLTDLNPDNDSYVTDCLYHIAQIIQTQNLTNYQIITNGPGYQNASYLHFHLLADL